MQRSVRVGQNFVNCRFINIKHLKLNTIDTIFSQDYKLIFSKIFKVCIAAIGKQYSL